MNVNLWKKLSNQSFLPLALETLDNMNIMPAKHKRNIPVPIGEPQPSISIKSAIAASYLTLILYDSTVIRYK